MRLTLRTLLAYIDEILEPADAAEMAKKIEESEFATGLMHRTRDLTRRLRLGAPKLDGRGMGLDPNTVAEYLDHTMPGERVPDFEKVCLESDIHLAEVASAHQILALVLGEPAEFDARSRERMYALAHVAQRAAAASDGASAAAIKEEPSDRPTKKKRKKRRRPEVPDYLREPSEPPRKSLWLAAALGVLVVAVAGALALKATSPDTWRRLTGQPLAVNDHADSQRASGDEAEPSPKEAETDTAAAEITDAKDQHSAPEPDRKRTEKHNEESTAARAPVADVSPSPSELGEDADAPIPPLPGEKPTRVPPADSAATPKAKQAPTQRKEPSEVIGRLISDHDVLLRWSGEKQVWERVPARESIHAGDRVMALPTYQPSVALGAGVTVQLLGGAMVELEGPDANGAPGIAIDDGRVLLLTVAKPDVFVRIQAAGHAGVAAFGRDDATLAVEVSRELPEGANPETDAALVRADLYVAGGEATFVRPGAGPEKIKAPGHRNLAAGPRSPSDAELPAWIKANELSPIEKRARTAIDEQLKPGEPVDSALQDLAVDKRLENSLLALRSLALMGDFAPLVSAFSDESPNAKNVWTPLIESLRAAMARGPKPAARVREAFQDQRGEQKGAALYRMLWGYNREQLQEGADRQLVEYLSSDDLDFRVLSFWNLHHLTGWHLSYRPEHPETRRRRAVPAWQQKLEKGLIVPASRTQ